MLAPHLTGEKLGPRQLKGLAHGDTFPQCHNLQAPIQALFTHPGVTWFQPLPPAPQGFLLF